MTKRLLDKLRSAYYSSCGRRHVASRDFNRWLYASLAKNMPMRDFVFMNLGYVDPTSGGDPLNLEQEDEIHRHSMQLYHHVLAPVRITGRTILEVGCGRGGGSQFIAKYHRPRRMDAIDICPELIALCQKHNDQPGLRFQVGDAESLPFSDDTFDAIISVESAHCYPSMAGRRRKQIRFLDEVARVLHPGGALLLADICCSREEMANLQDRLHDSDLEVRHVEDITAGVVRSRDLLSDCEVYRNQILEWAAESPAGTIEEVCSGFRDAFWFKGTKKFTELERGDTPYFCWHLVRPEAGP